MENLINELSRVVRTASGELDKRDLAPASQFDLINLSTWWKRYAKAFFTHRVFLNGWQTDYVRVSRLLFCSHIMKEIYPHLDQSFVLESSKDIPAKPVQMISEWLALVKSLHKIHKVKQPAQFEFCFEGEVFGWLWTNHWQIMARVGMLKEGRRGNTES